MVGSRSFLKAPRISSDAIRPPDLLVLSVDCGLLFLFRGTAHQYCEDPISVSHLPVLFDSGRRDETYRGAAGSGNDPFSSIRNNL